MPNGEIFVLPGGWFAQFNEILSLGKAEANKVILKPFHFMLLNENISSGNPELQERVRKLYSKEMADPEIPESLNARLRNYQ